MDSTDLLDDVLTLPSAAPVKTDSEDVEVRAFSVILSFCRSYGFVSFRRGLKLPLLPR